MFRRLLSGSFSRIDSFVSDPVRCASVMRSIASAKHASTLQAPEVNYRGVQLRSLSMTDRSIEQTTNNRRGRKVWKAREERIFHSGIQDGPPGINVQPTLWDKAVDDDDRLTVHESLARICEQVRVICSIL